MNEEIIHNINAKLLPYDENRLAPHLSKDTLYFHYEKHHLGYVKKVHEILREMPKIDDGQPMDLVSLIKFAKERGLQKLYNNSAQVWNHDFYWLSMTPEPIPDPEDFLYNEPAIQHLIEKSFGSVSNFQEKFVKESTAHFGSGWTWFVFNPQTKKVELSIAHDAETPVVTDQVPLLGCDLWEHAYYLDYKNEKENYLRHFWKIANWKFFKKQLESSL